MVARFVEMYTHKKHIKSLHIFSKVELQHQVNNVVYRSLEKITIGYFRVIFIHGKIFSSLGSPISIKHCFFIHLLKEFRCSFNFCHVTPVTKIFQCQISPKLQYMVGMPSIINQNHRGNVLCWQLSQRHRGPNSEILIISFVCRWQIFKIWSIF